MVYGLAWPLVGQVERAKADRIACPYVANNSSRMAPLLKNIRMKSILTDGARKYALYAVGEVTLIVIGILLAVQINAWNQRRIDHSREVEYLTRLEDEVRVNLDYFTSSLAGNEEAKAAINQFAQQITDKTVDADSLIKTTYRYFTVGALIPIFEPVSTTFDDLSSTGNMSLIQDPQLRDEIVGLYGKFSQFKSMHNINRDWTLGADARLETVYGSLKWDERTEHLYVAQTNREEARSLRSHIDVLLDHASVHFWTVDRVSEFNSESQQRCEALLSSIAAALEKA